VIRSRSGDLDLHVKLWRLQTALDTSLATAVLLVCNALGRD